MPREKIILTDLDGTVLDFVGKFHEYMRMRGYRRAPATPADDPYCLATPYGMTLKQIKAEIMHFFDQPDGGLLAPEPCARIVLPRLHREGWRFIGITAAPKKSRKKRMDNIKRAFGFEFTDLHCVGLEGSKEDLLRDYYGSVACWVEDHTPHAFIGANVGHRVFLLERAWNKDSATPYAMRVKDWHDIAGRL